MFWEILENHGWNFGWYKIQSLNSLWIPHHMVHKGIANASKHNRWIHIMFGYWKICLTHCRPMSHNLWAYLVINIEYGSYLSFILLFIFIFYLHLFYYFIFIFIHKRIKFILFQTAGIESYQLLAQYHRFPHCTGQTRLSFYQTHSNQYKSFDAVFWSLLSSYSTYNKISTHETKECLKQKRDTVL